MHWDSVNINIKINWWKKKARRNANYIKINKYLNWVRNVCVELKWFFFSRSVFIVSGNWAERMIIFIECATPLSLVSLLQTLQSLISIKKNNSLTTDYTDHFRFGGRSNSFRFSSFLDQKCSHIKLHKHWMQRFDRRGQFDWTELLKKKFFFSWFFLGHHATPTWCNRNV